MENLEELIKEAKRRFPIGCKFKSAYDINRKLVGTLYTCNGDNFVKWKSLTNAIVEKNSLGIIYENGVWAEVKTIEPLLFN